MSTPSPQDTTHALPPQYNPAQVEPAILERWLAHKAFHADAERSEAPADPSGVPFSIVIPPPNVTAALHLGHALNNTLQDVLIRHHRMLGHNTCWFPGTDHAGIATQTVVEKRVLAEEGKRRTDFQRDAFVEKIQQWKDEYEKRITDQLKLMGCSCDYDRQAFTMDEARSNAVREAFFQLFKDGLIYRGKRLVNWDPVTQTALADDEVEMQEVDGNFYYMKYPVCDASGKLTGEYTIVATTRPETMLGDTAVAVNPKDAPRAKYIGQYVKLPIVGRVIPIIADDYVVIPDENSEDAKARMASGFLKITPAHDPNDYDIGQRHALPIINVMAPDASISKDHGWAPEEQPAANTDLQPIFGLSREEARKHVVRWFKDHGLMQEIKPYRHAVGHSYRSHVPIEPYYSDQWYLKVTDDKLAGAALRAMTPSQRTEGTTCTWMQDHPFADQQSNIPADLTFTPPRYAKTFQQWHENIRDWCISRQLWWGHRIPVWSKRVQLTEKNWCDEIVATGFDHVINSASCPIASAADISVAIINSSTGKRYDLSTDPLQPIVPDTEGEYTIHVCLRHDHDGAYYEKRGYTQDPDVLDTWFSSALWPLSTMGWPDDTAELDTWNPTSVLCTAREIITLWVSRMVMFNLYFRGTLPFKDVFIHAMIQDGHGQKMSKSLGNGVDPIDIIHTHGSDAMRFTLTSMTTHTQDVRMPVDLLDPYSGEAFTPEFITLKNGYKVAAPIQTRNGQKIASSYGIASGEVKATEETPAARNTSEKFDLGQRFANKVWNATRFVLSNLKLLKPGADQPRALPEDALQLPDRWILARTAQAITDCNKHLANYAFSEYATTLYDLFWRDLCDWYIEAVKPTIGESETQQRVLAACLDASLRLMHPAMPFVTERLFEALNGTAPGSRSCGGLSLPASDLLCTACWPATDTSMLGDTSVEAFELIQSLVGTLREVRTTCKVPPRERVEMSIRTHAGHDEVIAKNRSIIESLSQTRCVGLGPDVHRPADAALGVMKGTEVYVHGVLDVATERTRLSKRADELQAQIASLEKRLSNKGYVDRAPAHLVQETRDQLAAAKAQSGQVHAQLTALPV